MISEICRRAARPLLLLLLLLPVSCGRQKAAPRPTIPLVREILAERTGPRAELLRGREPRPTSDITLIGTGFSCDRLAEQFSFRDKQDNVDATYQADGLLDFAGETFACIEDSGSYESVLNAMGADVLRRWTVQRVLAALDTAVHISPYDLEGLSSKRRSKAIVLADPFLAEYGGFDVDTLLSTTNCQIPVIRPVELMIDRAFANNGRGDLSVAILCDPQYASADIYEKIFARKAAAQGLKGATCVVAPVARRDSVLHTFLRDYLDAGQTKPLDAILVDDLSVSLDSLKTELAEIVSVMNESSMTIGRLITRDFFLTGAFEEVSDCCYSFLREHNLFTHNIAKPQVMVFRPVRKPESEDDAIILIPGSYVQN